MKIQTKKLAKQTRLFRKLHKWIAVPLLVFMFLLGGTGLLLAWKNELKLMPPTQKSAHLNTSNFISLNTIQFNAIKFVEDSLKLSTKIDRIDIRPSKGIAKVRFDGHFTELQVDCFSGDVISVKQRTADIIEKIHDGSILDFLLETENDDSKLIYSTITSLGLVILSLSGFFLWFYPKKLRNIKREGR